MSEKEEWQRQIDEANKVRCPTCGKPKLPDTTRFEPDVEFDHQSSAISLKWIADALDKQPEDYMLIKELSSQGYVTNQDQYIGVVLKLIKQSSFKIVRK